MKKIRIIIAAALAMSLTACSFFNKDNSIENDIEASSQEAVNEYSCQVSLEGGSGRATVDSPAKVVVEGDNKTVRLVWSSPNYDYMVVDGKHYDNEAVPGKNSVFTIPFDSYDEAFTVIGDTTAMSTPHEIEYLITVYSPSKGVLIGQSVPLESEEKSSEDEAVVLGDLKYIDSLKLQYATQFTVDYYEDEAGNNFSFITIGSEGTKQYFLYGNGSSKVVGLSSNITTLESVDKTYLVSTSVMDLVSSIDGLNYVRLSGTDSKDWYIDEAKKKMKQGDILYAGKYSAPDYELLLTEGCNFAIENTMIYHKPSVKEKLESLGIPVMVEYSSYEKSPLGRLEWIKLYGVLYNRLDKANEVFEAQVDRVGKVESKTNTGLKVAVFSITSNGQVVVRRPGDYISTMVEMAGGKYVPANLKNTDDNVISTVKITMEDFYMQASDADILIYNSTIQGEVSSIQELVARAEILGDFKAVKDNKVYCLEKSYFQRTGDVAELIEDINNILVDENEPLSFIYHIED